MKASEMGLDMGAGFFTPDELCAKAAQYKGLKLQERSSRASSPVKTYWLDDRLLALLAERGIRRIPRPDCGDEVFTLAKDGIIYGDDDEDDDDDVPVWETGRCWSFSRLEGGDGFDLKVRLSIDLYESFSRDGVVLAPNAYTTFDSHSGEFMSRIMFKVLIENDAGAPETARQLAASDTNIVVGWDELGLSGIRSLDKIFLDLAKVEAIMSLGMSGAVFRPKPFPLLSDECRLYVLASAQPALIETWRAQLKEYRDKLVI